MPFYQKRGEIPTKRHIQFRNNDNKLFWEELISREGFSNIYSNVYHKNPPTSIEKMGDFSEIKLLTVRISIAIATYFLVRLNEAVIVLPPEYLFYLMMT